MSSNSIFDFLFDGGASVKESLKVIEHILLAIHAQTSLYTMRSLDSL